MSCEFCPEASGWVLSRESRVASFELRVASFGEKRAEIADKAISALFFYNKNAWHQQDQHHKTLASIYCFTKRITALR